MKKPMLNKILEHMKDGNIEDSKDLSIIQTSIEIVPKIQMRKIRNLNDIQKKKERQKINSRNYRQRKRDERSKNPPKNPPKNPSTPLTSAERSKRYRDKKKNAKK